MHLLQNEEFSGSTNACPGGPLASLTFLSLMDVKTNTYRACYKLWCDPKNRVFGCRAVIFQQARKLLPPLPPLPSPSRVGGGGGVSVFLQNTFGLFEISLSSLLSKGYIETISSIYSGKQIGEKRLYSKGGKKGGSCRRRRSVKKQSLSRNQKGESTTPCWKCRWDHSHIGRIPWDHLLCLGDCSWNSGYTKISNRVPFYLYALFR